VTALSLAAVPAPRRCHAPREEYFGWLDDVFGEAPRTRGRDRVATIKSRRYFYNRAGPLRVQRPTRRRAAPAGVLCADCLPGCPGLLRRAPRPRYRPPRRTTPAGQPAGRHPARLPENPNLLRRGHRLGPPPQQRPPTSRVIVTTATGSHTRRACFDTRPGLSWELTGHGWPQAIAQRRFRTGAAAGRKGPRTGSPFTGRRPRKTISRLARLDPPPPPRPPT
jgi:hypothetical protein